MISTEINLKIAKIWYRLGCFVGDRGWKGLAIFFFAYSKITLEKNFDKNLANLAEQAIKHSERIGKKKEAKEIKTALRRARRRLDEEIIF
jgi:hypothetical protein